METITSCRACGGKDLIEFLDLGKQYISDFREDQSRPKKYPLVAIFCQRCKLVQLKYSTPQSEMYHERYGFKSGVSDSIRADLEENVKLGLRYKPTAKRWLDIASNDGTLLSFVPKDIYRVGVDPIKFLCDEAEQHANRIVNGYFNIRDFVDYSYDELYEVKYQKFDVITSISCFYDMPNPGKFVDEVTAVLAEDGVWIIQQNYLLATMDLGAVDNFCAEHVEYYTLLSLENLLSKYGLEINRIELPHVNGGSIRTVVSRKGKNPVDLSVGDQRAVEYSRNLENISSYQEFAEKAFEQLTKLKILVKTLKDQGKIIAILAASTRGATIWQSADIGPELVDYAIERNPAKVGKWFSAINIPIVSEREAHERTPDYMLVGPWFHIKEIVKRERDYINSGGSLIVPLPEVEIIHAGNISSYL